jgi:4-amino-4-deoxy-L-arabinose transferase-like glycosyltransferase
MTDMRRFGWTDFVLLLLVLLAAAGARAGYLWHFADSGGNAGPFRVQDRPRTLHELPDTAEMRGEKPPTELDALVHNLKEDQWYGCLAPFAIAEEATADSSPGYPWLLSLLARVIPDKVPFERTVRWSQAGLGALTAVLYFLFARRAFRSLTVGTLTGLFAAAYPFWIINTADLNDGVLTAFLLAGVLFLGVRASQTSGPFASLLYGLTLAGLALVRAAFLPFSFVALVWFLLRSRVEARGWLCALLAFLGFANGLAPWTVRNYQVWGEPVPIVDSTYLHLWIGNNPDADGGPLTQRMENTPHADELRAIKVQPRRYERCLTYVIDEVRDHPYETLQRRLNAALFYLFGKDTLQRDEPVEVLSGTWQGVRELMLGTLLVLFPLAFIGWRRSYGWRHESVPATLAVLLAPLPYLLSHAEALHGPRLPLDGILLCYAAFTLVCLIPGLGRRLSEGAKSAAPAETPAQRPAPGTPAAAPAAPSSQRPRTPQWRE